MIPSPSTASVQTGNFASQFSHGAGFSSRTMPFRGATWAVLVGLKGPLGAEVASTRLPAAIKGLRRTEFNFAGSGFHHTACELAGKN
jgi:hypothetical protein